MKKNRWYKVAVALLAGIIFFADTGGFLSGMPVYAEETVGQSAEVEERESNPRLEELIRAVKLGFGDDVDDTSRITYAEYYKMIEKLVALLAPDKVSQWQEKYPAARESRDGIERSNAMYLLYAAAQDILGEPYSHVTKRYTFQEWNWLAGYMEAPFENGGFPLNYEYFADAVQEQEFAGTGSVYPRTANAFFFSFAQSSCNGYFLFDYDKETNSMRGADPLTWQEAMLSVIRLYESVDPFEMETNWIPIDEVSGYNTEIITDELLARAQYMAEPTTENLPYYTGIELGQISTVNENITEAKMRLLADLGFNYVRVCVTCLDFFDEEITEADEAYLQKLDEIISWGLKYGLHVSLQFFDFPGHIQYVDYETNTITADSDFYTNEVKQQRTMKLWQTIARRYKGISNRALTFITNHEPANPARTSGLPYDPYTEEDIERVSKAVIAAIKEVDSERLLIYETRYDQCLDTFMADADVIQTSIFAVNHFVYWNLNTDINMTEGYVPTWPYYEIPSTLDADKRTLTVGGTLPAGTAFSLKIKNSWTTGESYPTLTVKVDGEEAVNQLCSETGDTVSFSLTKQAQSVEIGIDTGGLAFEQFLVTLPEEYASEKYYFGGTDNSISDSGTVEKRNNSELDINLGYQYAEYMKPGDTSLRAYWDSAWILDESDTEDLTITPEGSYISRYGYNAETMKKRAALYASQREQYQVQGMNFELVTNSGVPVEDTCKYLEDTLTAYQEENIGWALFYEMDLSAPRHPNSVLETVECGVMLDTKILEVLQKHQGERPKIMTEVPKIAHEYEEVNVEATYENAGYHALVCRYCGDEKDYILYPKLEYSFNAALYETAECQEETRQELGEFDSIAALNTALEGKTGCLVLSLEKDADLSELPSGTGITALIVTSYGEKQYTMNYTGTELTLSADTRFETKVKLEKEKVALWAEDHVLTLKNMELCGTSFDANGATIECAETVSLSTAITNPGIFSVNVNRTVGQNGTNLEWTNVYGNTHVFVNGEISGVSELRMYGDNLYLSKTGSFSADAVTGIYGNVFLEKTDGTLPAFTVRQTMADMTWQIRIYTLATTANPVWNGEAGVLCKIDEGTVFACVPAGADKSCTEKLGYMTDWDSWDDYGKTLYKNGKLYFGAAKVVCAHTNTLVRGAASAACTKAGYTGDTYCKDCGELVSKGKSIAALGHSYKATVTKQPTVDAEGVKTYTCSRCKASYTEKIAKLTVTYTVKFNGNGADSGSVANQKMTYGSKTALNANKFQKKGYTFKNWNTKKDGSGNAYANKADGSKLTKTNGTTVTLYAQWNVNKYTITFNGNGSTSGSMKKLSNCKYGKKYTLTKNGFKKKGYTFTGWNTKKDGSGKTYKNKAEVKNLSAKADGKVTLYAQWKKTKYTITYNLNKGKNNKNNPSSYNITTKTIKLKSPTRKGYTFVGWYSDKKCTKKVTQIKKGSTGNITLYAKWKKK